jgi:type IX secretion system PorP/SprF family membrane protein
MKIILFLIILVCSTVYGQQLPLYSQYTNNEFLINPSLTGIKNETSFQIGYRKQWSGFKGSPSTSILGGQTQITKKNMGLGGVIFLDDRGGAIKQTGFMLNYSYFIKISETSKIALGLAGILNQYTFNSSTIIAENTNDKSLFTNLKSTTPDLNIGTSYINKNFKIGFSINQIFQSRISKWNELNINADNKLVRHFNFSASNIFKLNEKLIIEPYFVARTILKSQIQFDFGSSLIYNEKLYCSLAYRTKEAFILSLGINHKKYSIGYSYDITTSLLRKYSAGTHEIVLKYRFH